MHRMNGATAQPQIELEIGELTFQSAGEFETAGPGWTGETLPDPLFDAHLCFPSAAGSSQ